MHPGPNGEYSVVRFTAPEPGSIDITGSFFKIDSGATTDVHVIDNAATIFDGTIGPANSVPFSLTRSVVAGETIDFAVGYGSNQTFSGDSTGLDARVTNASTGRIFGEKVDYTTGSEPYSVTAADVNADGAMDLISANGASDTVSVLLGRGDGTFAPKVDYAAGETPHSVAAADFNGDHKLDLAVANWYGSTLSVLLNAGEGTFRRSVDYKTGSSPRSVTAADFNGDGKPDLAVANWGGATLSVLMNKGNGTFSSKSDYSTGSSPLSIVAADFSGDGRPDLAVANWNDRNLVSVLLNSGSGTFGQRVDYAVGATPHAVTTADFNFDGRADLAVANEYGDSVSVLLNNGAGVFAATVDYPTGDCPKGIATADVNGDGMPDLYTANFDDNSVSVLLNLGEGRFSAHRDFAANKQPFGVTGADFNGDNRDDLAVANSGESNSPHGTNISVMLSAGCLEPSVPYVQINQSSGQPDSTGDSPINFSVVFTQLVSDFTSEDVVVSGTAGATEAVVTGSGKIYNVAVSGMTMAGTVIATIPAGAAHDATGNLSVASRSLDNVVTYTLPRVTINQLSAQRDPCVASSVAFTVQFSEPVRWLSPEERMNRPIIVLSGSAKPSKYEISPVGADGKTYQITVSGMKRRGAIVARVPAGIACDADGCLNTASTSSDNCVRTRDVAEVSKGTLSLFGTAQSDKISLLLSGSAVIASVGSSSFRFSADKITGVEVCGWGGDDSISIGSGVCAATIFGGDGNDTIVGAGGNDRIFGDAGDDLLQGMSGNDRICGGTGNDSIEGGSGKDALFGERGLDTIDGGEQNDRLCGGPGCDLLLGGDGDDAFRCSDHEPDVLNGGIGSDTADCDVCDRRLRVECWL